MADTHKDWRSYAALAGGRRQYARRYYKVYDSKKSGVMTAREGGMKSPKIYSGSLKNVTFESQSSAENGGETTLIRI